MAVCIIATFDASILMSMTNIAACVARCVQGMLRSRGRRLLFADADGATQFSDIQKLEAELLKLEQTSQASISGLYYTVFCKFCY